MTAKRTVVLNDRVQTTYASDIVGFREQSFCICCQCSMSIVLFFIIRASLRLCIFRESWIFFSLNDYFYQLVFEDEVKMGMQKGWLLRNNDDNGVYRFWGFKRKFEESWLNRKLSNIYEDDVFKWHDSNEIQLLLCISEQSLKSEYTIKCFFKKSIEREIFKLSRYLMKILFNGWLINWRSFSKTFAIMKTVISSCSKINI